MTESVRQVRLFKISRTWCRCVYNHMVDYDGHVQVELDGLDLEEFVRKLIRFNRDAKIDFFPRFY